METKSAKTIQIFLPDGDPRNGRIAEMKGVIISAIEFSRSNHEIIFKRGDINFSGIYFLFEQDGYGLDRVYIGEANNCRTRIISHTNKKELWSKAVIITSNSNTQLFSPTDIKYLEYYCLLMAKDSGRYKIQNSNRPKEILLSEPDKANLHQHFHSIKLLLSTLGYPLFEKIAPPKPKDILYCKEAQGEYTNDGFIVFKGSKCKIKEALKARKNIKIIRDKLIEDGILKHNNDSCIFQKTHVFKTPSAAAEVVLGCSANGWISWKYKDGRTLDEVKRQNISE